MGDIPEGNSSRGNQIKITSNNLRSTNYFYNNMLLLKISHTALFCLHSNAFSGTLLDILRTYAIFVYFALVPSHALGA